MWLALQLSHNDVLGVGLGWVLGLGGPESLPIKRSEESNPKSNTENVQCASSYAVKVMTKCFRMGLKDLMC